MRLLCHILLLVSGFLFVPTLSAQEKLDLNKLPINTSDREYAAAFYKGGIVFNSNRKNDLWITYTDEKNESLTDMFYISGDSIGKVNPALFSKELRTAFHDGPITFSNDGKTAYYTRNQRAYRKIGDAVKEDNYLGVYKAVYENGRWKEVETCAFNNPEYSTGQPCLSADGKSLYVVSDKPGGKGGTDLYVSQIKDGKCGPLQNLGDNINTAGNEMFPFFHENGILFFSSDGREGRGGLDVYYSYQHKKDWLKIYTMDTAVNSSADDFAYITGKNLQKGYFSSNRDGSDDIYAYNMTFPEFNVCDTIQPTYLCYRFFEEATLEGNDSLPLIYEWDFGDGTTTRALETDHCFPGPGIYTIELNVIDTIIKRVFMSEATYELEIVSPEQPFITSQDTVLLGTVISFDSKATKWSMFEVNKFFWDFDDGTRFMGPSARHTFESTGSYAIKLGITSEILDDIGTYYDACAFKNVLVVDSSTTEGKKIMHRNQNQTQGTLIDKNTNEPLGNVEILVESEDGTVSEKVTTNADGTFDLRKFAYDQSYNITLVEEKDSENLILLIFNDKGQLVMTLEKDLTGAFVYKRDASEIDQEWINTLAQSSHLSIPADSVDFYKDSLVSLGVDDPDRTMENILYRLELLRSQEKMNKDTFDILTDSVTEHYITKDELYSYTIGEGKSPEELHEAYQRVHLAGFENATVEQFEDTTNANVLSINEMEELSVPNIINKVIVLDDVLFDFDGDQLDANDKIIIDRLLDFMKVNPEVNVQIMAHTDNNGDGLYNLQLSKRRAKSVMNYLISSGIQKQRLTARGFGEEKPLKSNATKAGQAANRRVEFKIVE